MQRTVSSNALLAGGRALRPKLEPLGLARKHRSTDGPSEIDKLLRLYLKGPLDPEISIRLVLTEDQVERDVSKTSAGLQRKLEILRLAPASAKFCSAGRGMTERLSCIEEHEKVAFKQGGVGNACERMRAYGRFD